MPLYRFSAAEALANRKGRDFTVWGNRATENRVEPIARPKFSVPFQIAPGAKIFTVGSCFARMIELELVRRGFDLPMRTLFHKEDTSALLNNYATPSLYNEFAWAFGEREFIPDDHIVELQPGGFVDLHLPPAMRPQPRERVIRRRNQITQAYRTVAECPILIMTLGLSEVWFDKKADGYINVAPWPQHLRIEPERFELHVLSYEESYSYLDRAIRIVRKHGREDLKILLTVSPVPLVVTHRDEDVMVANTYSKSVLRAAAEALVAEHDIVTYYPSYESVMLSDRKRAWRDDLIHVTEELIAFNVGRMIDAFIGGAESADDIRVAIEHGGGPVAVEKAKAVRAGSREKAGEFFAAFSSMSRQSPEFAMEHANFLFDTNDHAGVLEIFAIAPPGMPEILGALLQARTLMAMGRPHDAMALLAPIGDKTDGVAMKSLRVGQFWSVYLDTAKATGEEDLVFGVLGKYVTAIPPHASLANAAVGRWFQEQGRLERAIPFFEMALAETDNAGHRAHLYLAECLAAQGKTREARAILVRMIPEGAGDKFLHDRMMARLGDIV